MVERRRQGIKRQGCARGIDQWGALGSSIPLSFEILPILLSQLPYGCIIPLPISRSMKVGGRSWTTIAGAWLGSLTSIFSSQVDHSGILFYDTPRGQGWFVVEVCISGGSDWEARKLAATHEELHRICLRSTWSIGCTTYKIWEQRGV